MDTVWVVIPTYNEAGTVVPLVEAVRSVAGADPDTQWRILIVDDNSPDGTGLAAGGLARSRRGVEVLHRPRKQGLGRAYVDGFRRALDAGADYVLQMDADFSHDPADLPRLLAAVRDGADLAIGSRYVAGGAIEGWSTHRRLLSRAGSRYAQRVLGVGIHDLTGGMKCFRAGVLEAIALDTLQASGYAFQVETTYRVLRLGMAVTEVPIVFRERTLGRSKMSLRIAAEAVWRIPRLRERSAAPAAFPVHAA